VQPPAGLLGDTSLAKCAAKTLVACKLLGLALQTACCAVC
jgi:hypothetical protein